MKKKKVSCINTGIIPDMGDIEEEYLKEVFK
jgi:hypothetical protein